jgi:ABC-type transport system involved in multi-copper enzyme maturation permease subunit
MRSILAIAGAVFADAIRRKVVIGVLFFAAVLTMAIPSLPSYGVGVVEGVYREVALALTFVGALVLTLSLAANRVPGEIERRTVYSVITRPVARWQYIVATWLGIMAVVAGAIACFTAIEQVWALLQYRDPMWRLWQGALAILMETGVIAALCVTISAVTGPVVVVVAALTFLFIGHSRDGVLGEKASDLARALYPSLDTFNIINPVAHGTGIGWAYLGGMTLAFVGWCALLLLVGSALFARRDL